jgi:hypothetical protein
VALSPSQYRAFAPAARRGAEYEDEYEGEYEGEGESESEDSDLN